MNKNEVTKIIKEHLEAGENLYLPIIHPHREMDYQFPFTLTQP
jgi:hypothetical protein